MQKRVCVRAASIYKQVCARGVALRLPRAVEGVGRKQGPVGHAEGRAAKHYCVERAQAADQRRPRLCVVRLRGVE